MILTDLYVREHLPEIKTEYHKYNRGRLLLIAGSYGMAGAAVLAALSALKAGVGYLNMAVTKEIYPILQVAVPEAVFTVYEDPEELLEVIGKADAVAVGPGLQEMAFFVLKVLRQFPEKKLLLDADGLNALSGAYGDVAEFRPDHLLLTPHEGEAARLLSCTPEKVHKEREKMAEEMAERYHAAVLLKGPQTVITDGNGMAVNPTGGPYLATAGSGDVLTGIIGAFLAQGADCFSALCMGAYIHGKSGDFAARLVGTRSCRPMDVISAIPAVLKQIEADGKGETV